MIGLSENTIESIREFFDDDFLDIIKECLKNNVEDKKMRRIVNSNIIYLNHVCINRYEYVKKYGKVYISRLIIAFMEMLSSIYDIDFYERWYGRCDDIYYHED